MVSTHLQMIESILKNWHAFPLRERFRLRFDFMARSTINILFVLQLLSHDKELEFFNKDLHEFEIEFPPR